MTKKLLLADDSITIQKVIGIIFATKDYQLIVTDNGDEAYETALQEYPDLVIADISMPGKGGFELCEAIKRDSRLPHTSVLLLPGTFEYFDEEHAEAVGADGWIHKPFESQAFLDKVAQLLEAEPVRLGGQSLVPEAPVVAVAPVEPQEQSLDEVVLGLDEMDEGPGSAEEESSEAIWDAVSFEEEDLQESAPADAEPEDLVVAAPETAETTATERDFSGTEDLVLEDVGEVFEPSETEPWEEAPLDLVEEAPVEFPRAGDDIDFSAQEEEPLAAGEDAGEEGLAFEEASLETLEELAGSGEVFLTAEDLAEQEPLAATAEEITEEPPVAVAPEFAGEISAEPEAEALEGLPAEEEEILELAEEDILEEELPAEAFYAEPPAHEEATAVEEEPQLGLEEPIFDGPVAEAIDDELDAEEQIGEEIDVQPEVIEDEGFFFDDVAAAEEAVGSAAEPEPVMAATLAEEPATASIEQVERQLRELSAEELKDVVSKVAGPMIEKLANEMLAQIAWEVVPDLAEAMIREEIRKIKQGVE